MLSGSNDINRKPDQLMMVLSKNPLPMLSRASTRLTTRELFNILNDWQESTSLKELESMTKAKPTRKLWQCDHSGMPHALGLHQNFGATLFIQQFKTSTTVFL